MDINDLKAALSKLDLLLKPYAMYVNPRNKEIILKALEDLGNLGDKFLVIDTDFVELDKVYIIKRDSLGI